MKAWINLLIFSVAWAATAQDFDALLIDMGHDGIFFSMGGEENPVVFDLNGSGNPEAFQWVKPHDNNAFLVYDMNQNALVDGGVELFGAAGASRFEDVEAHNGFDLLALYDKKEHGGNGDLAITERDSIWKHLYLWLDADADGVSQPSEMTRLSNSKIARILVKPTPNTPIVSDENGNQYGATSLAVSKSYPPETFRTLLVFFKKAP